MEETKNFMSVVSGHVRNTALGHAKLWSFRTHQSIELKRGIKYSRSLCTNCHCVIELDKKKKEEERIRQKKRSLELKLANN